MIARIWVLALAACNPLLGLDEPTLVPDASTPGCATGWQYARPLLIDSSLALRDHQVPLLLNTAALIAEGKLRPDGADLRVVTEGGDLVPHVIERAFDSATTRLWIRLPEITNGTTSFSLRYGNPQATAFTAPVFETAITNPSFESMGGWTIDPAIGPPGTFVLQVPEWASDGLGSLLIDEKVDGERASTSASSVSQPANFPVGFDYVVRLDINVIAASNGGVNGTNNGAFLLTLGNGITNLWVLNGDQGNITGIHLDQESSPFSGGPALLTVMARVVGGAGPGYAKGFLDNMRVRKYALPEPTAMTGPETSCP